MALHMKRIAKYLIGQTLNRTGLWQQLLRRWARRHEGLILTYHRVLDKWDSTLDYSQPGMVVTADTLDRQLAFLKEHFDVVPLSFLINSKFEIRNSKLFSRPLGAITFDDGWRDNYELAFPILRKHGLPATIFLTTDFIGTDRVYWHTELLYLLLHGRLSRLRQDSPNFRTYPSLVRQALRRLARMRAPRQAQDAEFLIEAVKELCDEETIERLIQDIVESSGLSRPLFPGRMFFLDWNQVREMAAAGIEIGSHGCSHRIMTRLKPEEAKQELIQSKAEIEQRIGRQIQHFAFPNGNFDRGLMTLAWKTGYRTACLCGVGGDERRFGSLALQRVGMAEGVSRGRDAAFSEASLLLWLLRAPRVSTT